MSKYDTDILLATTENLDYILIMLLDGQRRDAPSLSIELQTKIYKYIKYTALIYDHLRADHAVYFGDLLAFERGSSLAPLIALVRRHNLIRAQVGGSKLAAELINIFGTLNWRLSDLCRAHIASAILLPQPSKADHASHL